MASKDIYLYDELSLQWEKVATNGDIETLATNLEDHELELLHTEQGVHGVRFWNNKLEYSDDGGVTWIEIQTGGGGASLPISANDVSENSNRVFVSASEKSQISANGSDISSLGGRVTSVENAISTLTSTDEKVKMSALDSTAGYLEDKVDNNTIQSMNNKLIARSLYGLTSTIGELNQLAGVTGNIQSQIDNLSSLVSPSQVVDTELDLPNPPLPSGEVVLVRSDSGHGGNTTFYMSDGNQWQFVDVLDAGIARNFTTDPLNLTTETTGILQKSKYEKQNALETPFTDVDGDLISHNTRDAIKEVFQLSDNIRKSWSNVIGTPLTQNDTLNQQLIKYNSLFSDLTDAISLKGVPTYSYNKLSELPARVLAIPNVTIDAGLNKVSKLNVVAPYTYNLTLSNAISLGDVTTTLIEFIQGAQGVVHYDVGFDNTDENDFVYNPYISYDGKMELRTHWNYNLTNDTSWNEDGYFYTSDILNSDLEIQSLSVGV